ncbi:MAG: 16S rRNA (adenine(1518)-N(6)/adenine(1519)-N(6))-dimethyltransferase RsmA [Planctomycetota bacterium]
MAQTLTDIKNLLDAHGLRPKHKFGQNFLHDGNHMRRILDAAKLSAGDVVLEVGPGTGALTERLLDEGVRVVAVEIDPQLQPILEQRIGGMPGDAAERFTLVVGDVLAKKHVVSPAVIEPVMAAVAEARAGGFKLIANLPYQVASPLLANLVVAHPAMSDAVVMVQKEVADRLAADPGGKSYGPLGILIQALCAVRTVGVLPPSCFWPPPKVASAVVHLRRRGSPMTDDARALSDTLQQLFGQRRKQLGSILGRKTPLPPGIDADARPESLSVEQLIALSRSLR